MIAFRKLFSTLHEGAVPLSIIGYKKKPYSWGDRYNEVAHRLYIDLWLVVFHFQWVRKIKK